MDSLLASYAVLLSGSVAVFGLAGYLLREIRRTEKRVGARFAAFRTSVTPGEVAALTHSLKRLAERADECDTRSVNLRKSLHGEIRAARSKTREELVKHIGAEIGDLDASLSGEIEERCGALEREGHRAPQVEELKATLAFVKMSANVTGKTAATSQKLFEEQILERFTIIATSLEDLVKSTLREFAEELTTIADRVNCLEFTLGLERDDVDRLVEIGGLLETHFELLRSGEPSGAITLEHVRNVVGVVVTLLDSKTRSHIAHLEARVNSLEKRPKI